MTAPAQPRSGHYDSLGLQLHYLEWGDAEAPPVLLVHGGLDCAWSWAEIAQALQADFRVLALDLRGHGESGWSMGGDYHTHSFLGDIATFMAEKIGRPTALVGHSMGARLALFVAGAAPETVSRLVALEGLGGRREVAPDEAADSRMRAWMEARNARFAAGHVAQVGHWLRARASYRRRAHRPYRDLAEAAARLGQGDDKKLTPEQALEFARTNLRADGEGRLIWKFDPAVRWHIGAEAREPEPRSYYANIRCPVLHVYGEESWAYPPAEQDVAAFAEGRLMTIAGAGHWVHFNQPARVTAEIQNFLRAPAKSPVA
jgi:pimeloyl-ACP methyl ester carboxylesterase